MGNREPFCCGRDCPNVTPGAVEQELADPHACDPAGAVFHETLEDLNEVDRLLLLFAASTNVTAVRWLQFLGANVDACDANGTTSLHSACRSGSLLVVRELVRAGVSVGATDVAGWTPLHVAVFMGRRSATVHLLDNGAQLHARNEGGLTPIDLCSDSWLREAITAFVTHKRNDSKAPWSCSAEHENWEDVQASSRLRFEPFFVPRMPVIKEPTHTAELRMLGVAIFNRCPGQGLAFLVASGAVRDFPIELSSFLMEHRVDQSRVGKFLGEDFSLAQTLRLEYFNSVRLAGTGVVSCLAKVFRQIQLPSDMRKIDRLVDGVAQIWWRQHEQIKEAPRPMAGRPELSDGKEVDGSELMHVVVNYSTLHQLMYSTVLLHWNLYATLPPSQRLSCEQWMDLNQGIAVAVGDVSALEHGRSSLVGMRRTLRLIYGMVARAFIPQLQIWPSAPGEGRAPAAIFPGSAAKSQDIYIPEPLSGTHVEVSVESWGRLVGGGFPPPAGITGTVTYKHIRGMLSETSTTAPTPSSSRPEPLDAGGGWQAPTLDNPVATALRFPPATNDDRLFVDASAPSSGQRAPMSTSERAWLSLCGQQLLFAPQSRDWVPYAFLYLDDGVVWQSDEKSLTFTLHSSVGAPPVAAAGTAAASAEDQELSAATATERSKTGQVQPSSSDVAVGTQGRLQVVFLLPDGRWQVLELPRLQVQVNNAETLGRWTDGLSRRCEQAFAAARSRGKVVNSKNPEI